MPVTNEFLFMIQIYHFLGLFGKEIAVAVAAACCDLLVTGNSISYPG